MIESIYSKYFGAGLKYQRDRSPKPTIKPKKKSMAKLENALKRAQDADPAEEFENEVKKLKEEGLDLKQIYQPIKVEDVEASKVRTCLT